MRNLHEHKYRLPCLASSALVVLFSCAAANANEQEIHTLVSGNTLLVTNKYGPSNVYFDPSGVLLSRGKDPVIDKGRWRATDDSVCSVMDPKLDGKTFPEFCMSFKGKKIDEEWIGDDPKNGRLVFKLLRGNVRDAQ